MAKSKPEFEPGMHFDKTCLATDKNGVAWWIVVGHDYGFITLAEVGKGTIDPHAGEPDFDDYVTEKRQ